MTALDDAAASAQRAVDAHGGEWLDRGLHAALDLVEAQQATTPSGSFEGAMLREAVAGLDNVALMRPQILSIGSDLSKRVLGQIAVGRPEVARAVARGTPLTFAQRRALKAEETERERTLTAARVAATEALISRAETIGLAALKAALPFLLAAL